MLPQRRVVLSVSITVLFLAALLITVPDGSISASDGPPASAAVEAESGAVPALLQAAFVVNSVADAVDASPGDGVCATASGACTLRAAVQESNATTGPSAIRLPAGTYRLTIAGADENGSATGDLDVHGTVSIVGTSGRDRTAVHSAVADRVIDIHDGSTVILRGLTIAGGRDVGGGGGVQNTRASLTLRESTVVSNSAGSGGGINNYEAQLEVIGSRISGNSASGNGGAIRNATGRSRSSVRIVDSLIVGNDAGYAGGGIESGGWGGDAVVVASSEISGNSAGYSGGGLELGSWAHSALVVSNSQIEDNEATYSGGSFILGSWGVTSATITASTISGSSADYSGGAMQLGSWGCTTVTIENGLIADNTSRRGGGLSAGSWGTTTAFITNTTLTGNIATSSGGALSAGSWGVTTARLHQATLADNQAPLGGSVFAANSHNQGQTTVAYRSSILDRRGTGNVCDGSGAVNLLSHGYNIATDNSCNVFGVGDASAVDPLLTALDWRGGPTAAHGLMSSSPAIDAADAAHCPGIDQRYAPRPAGAGCDVGAVESGAVAPTMPSEWPVPPIPYVPAPPEWPTGGGMECSWPIDDQPKATPSPQPGPLVTPVPPATCVCRIAHREAPLAAIQHALANPPLYDGWMKLHDPGKPESPVNPRQECLTLLNQNVRYHRWYNGLVWRAWCR